MGVWLSEPKRGSGVLCSPWLRGLTVAAKVLGAGSKSKMLKTDCV